MENGSNMTDPVARTERIGLIRATRNAERYCDFYHDSPRYVVISKSTEYEGLLNSEEAARKVEKGGEIARKLTFGVVQPGLDTDWRTTLVFRCDP